MASAVKKTTDVVLDVVTWMFAALGIASLLSILVSMWFGVTIVLFATDSMSPVMPKNTAALAIRIPASEIQVGDVVTIDRADDMPISHRVIEIAPSKNGEDKRIIITKGDANLSVDPAKHEVDQVRRIFFSVPGLAPAFTLLSDLRMLIAIGIVVLGLVVRAFLRPGAEPQRAVEDAHDSEPTR